jgi:MinD-like ATPase involved in chromosome partitioning or flagellar assembly
MRPSAALWHGSTEERALYPIIGAPVTPLKTGKRQPNQIAASPLANRGVTLTMVDTAGGWSDACRGAMAAADFCLIPARPNPADIEAAAPTLAAVRESGKPFAFVLNQVQARSTRLNGAAGSLGERAVALKMADVLALPAIVLRNDQQDAVGVGLGVTEYAPRGKSAEEIPRPVAMGLGAAKPRLAARRGSAALPAIIGSVFLKARRRTKA